MTVREGEGGGWWVRVHGESWRVRSPAPLRPGARVRVTAMDGLVLTVSPRVTSPKQGVHRDVRTFNWALRRSSCCCSSLVAASIKILREYERGVIFLLGRF